MLTGVPKRRHGVRELLKVKGSGFTVDPSEFKQGFELLMVQPQTSYVQG